MPSKSYKNHAPGLQSGHCGLLEAIRGSNKKININDALLQPVIVI